MYQLLPVLLEGLSAAEQRSTLERLGASPDATVPGGPRTDRAPAPLRSAQPAPRPAYRSRPTPGELDAIAAAPWRGWS